MAGTTFIPILTIMWIFMAGDTRGRRPFIYPVLMAGFTGNIAMFAYQRERSVIVIESHIAPTTSVMTRTAIRPEAAAVLIIICMAGITLRRSSLVSIRMTGITRQILVLPGQRETGL